MKHIKYFTIILLCLSVFQDVAAQVRVNVGVRNRPKYYRQPIYYHNNRPRTVIVARPPIRYASPYRSSGYYNRPVVVNRYYYGGGYHPYPSYYRPFNRPSFGISINVLPRGYYPFSLGRNRYYYNDGLYYQPYQGYYQTIAPPLGALVPSLPRSATAVNINNDTYYEYNGTYYQHAYNSPGKYEVVGVDGVLNTDNQANFTGDNFEAPNTGESLSSLPENFKTVVLDNKVYYVTPAGEYYTKNIDEKGNITYVIESK